MRDGWFSKSLVSIALALANANAFAHPGHDGAGAADGWSLAHFLSSPGHKPGLAILVLCAAVLGVRKYLHARALRLRASDTGR